MRKPDGDPGRSSQLSIGLPGRGEGEDHPAGALSDLTKEALMTTTPAPALTRAERLWLACAALRGALSGAARAITAWLLEQHLH